MTITVKFFASLSEQLGKKEIQLNVPQDASLKQIWQQATEHSEMPVNILMAINMEYATADSIVKENDEVAFFPPVTGGQK